VRGRGLGRVQRPCALEHSPQAAFADVRDYCRGRLLKGFTVTVLTVLPRSDVQAPPTFEAARQDLNLLIRTTGVSSPTL